VPHWVSWVAPWNTIIRGLKKPRVSTLDFDEAKYYLLFKRGRQDVDADIAKALTTLCSRCRPRCGLSLEWADRAATEVSLS
jgi:hypothetical protein